MLGDVVFEALGVLLRGAFEAVVEAFVRLPGGRWVGRIVAALLVASGLAASAPADLGRVGLAVAALGALVLACDGVQVLLARRSP